MKRVHIRSISFILLLACFSAHADFSFEYQRHTYEVITSNKNWKGSQLYAQSRSIGGKTGYLVIINDKNENNEIFKQLRKKISSASHSKTKAPDGGGGSYVWIGASDIKKEGKWIWSNGVNFWRGNSSGKAVKGNFNNWPKGKEPDDYLKKQDAAGISLNGWPLGKAGQWNDVNSKNKLFFIIEYDAIGKIVKQKNKK